MQLFSLETAGALIPQVAPLVNDLLERRRTLAIRLLELDPALSRHTASAADENEVEALKRGIVGTIARIESFGCIVKDIDLGLLDFPAMREGRRIVLCWKAGEPEIRFWHGTGENFAARKSLES